MSIALLVLLFGMIVALIMLFVGIINDFEFLALSGVLVAIMTAITSVALIVVSSNHHVDTFRHKCEKLGGHVNGNGDLCLKPGSEIHIP